LNIEAYLDRIDYRGSLEPTRETLQRLHLAHLLAVPFENLSIHAGQPIILSDEALFEKVVIRRRGGFCYELNGLFAALLRTLGFDVTMLSARVANSEGVLGPEFDHMTLLVRLEERWLADAGFGDSFLFPLRLDSHEPQVQSPREYIVNEAGSDFSVAQRESGHDWKEQYRFTLQPHGYSDFREMCRYQQTSPQSHFTQGRICTLPTAAGRMSLSELRLITTDHGERTERELSGEEEFSSLLREQFGIAEELHFKSRVTTV
jgi:N-hydroxyarylamine O-acetyltransferase